MKDQRSEAGGREMPSGEPHERKWAPTAANVRAGLPCRAGDWSVLLDIRHLDARGGQTPLVSTGTFERNVAPTKGAA